MPLPLKKILLLVKPAVVVEWSKLLMLFTPILKLADPGSNPAWDMKTFIWCRSLF